MKSPLPFLALAAALAAMPAHAADARKGDIAVTGAWSRPTPPGAPTGAGYMVLANTGRTADRLVSATSPASATVEIHESSVQGGVMTMRPLKAGVVLPPGGRAELKPGGMHLMLIGLKAGLSAGSTVPVVLTFEKVGRVEVAFDVRQPGAAAAAPEHQHDHQHGAHR